MRSFFVVYPAGFEPARECVRAYYIRPSTEIDGTKMTGAIGHSEIGHISKKGIFRMKS